MRSILHSDLNNYYASVEMVLNPALRGKPIAVAGNKEERHGVVVAKSELAKKAGVETTMTVVEAERCCPDIVFVPPHFDEYRKYSRAVRNIYTRYTHLVEPFGLDECWLDVSGKSGDAMQIAEEIRAATKRELGLTVSIGVSFNKVFAKLGSDLKKPDAITCIPYERFREIVWPLPVGALLGVGPATQKKLHMRCVETIGDLANTPIGFLQDWFGVAGKRMWQNANGMDDSPVASADEVRTAKSISHGTTTPKDLETNEDVRKLLEELTPTVCRKLKDGRQYARGVQLSVRTNDLVWHQFQAHLPHATQDASEIIEAAMRLFEQRYGWEKGIMGLTIGAINLENPPENRQLDFLQDTAQFVRKNNLQNAIGEVNAAFGAGTLIPASALQSHDTEKPN